MSADGNCTACEFKRGMVNSKPGVKIPGDHGKCIREGGLCPAKSSSVSTIDGAGALLSMAELRRLHELETIIEDNFAAWYRVGKALAEINAKRLYIATHDTFEAYARDRFETARRTAYQYIEGAAVFDRVRTCAQIEILPQKESHVRPLAALPAEQQTDAWETAVRTAPDGRVTAGHVKLTVARMKGEKIQEKTRDTQRHAKEDPGLTDKFKDAYWEMANEIRSAATQAWKTMDREATRRHIEGLLNLLED